MVSGEDWACAAGGKRAIPEIRAGRSTPRINPRDNPGRPVRGELILSEVLWGDMRASLPYPYDNGAHNPYPLAIHALIRLRGPPRYRHHLHLTILAPDLLECLRPGAKAGPAYPPSGEVRNTLSSPLPLVSPLIGPGESWAVDYSSRATGASAPPDPPGARRSAGSGPGASGPAP